MSNRLFKVDLSDGARDFKPTATEPGLAMLDRNNANYSILRRWLGEYVAEPEWMGQDAQFFVREESRGRLESVHCTPCSKADLLGPLQSQLEEIDQKLRKAKPETANEQLLHRIIRKKFTDLTRDYDASDFHCHFFKYRQGSEPPRLIWVWGYQRTDVEPARSIICGNPECEALYARRPKQKARCPVCASSALRGRKPPPPLWMRIAQLALLLLLLLSFVGFAILMAANRPRLVVTPGDWSGPPGSRVQYKVEHKRWVFWNDDVTTKVVPQSYDKRIVRFEPSGSLAKARAPGNAFVTFRFKDLASDATVNVGQPLQPASIKLEPAGDIRLASGATKQVTLVGTYKPEQKLDPVDLTEMSQWSTDDAAVAFFAKAGICEGGSEGISNFTAKYRANEKDKWLDVTAKAIVTKVDYQSIEVVVTPTTFGMGRSGAIEVNGIGPDGDKHSLVGSSLLKLTIEPDNVAKVEGNYLYGMSKGSAELSASFLNDEYTAKTTFNVGDSALPRGTFVVSPAEAKIKVTEYLELDVLSASSEEIDTTSSDTEIVAVIGDRTLIGLKPGKATVTLKQGNATTRVEVTVTESNIVSLHIDPPIVTLVSGVASPIRVFARDKSGNEIDVAPDRITWVKQPPLEYAELDRRSLALFGITPSSEYWPLVAQLGTNEAIQAKADVKVVSNSLASTTVIGIGGDEFLAHPPVRVFGGRYVLDTGVGTEGNLVFHEGSVIVNDGLSNDSWFRRSNIPSGARIVQIGDTTLDGLSREEIAAYFRNHRLLDGTRVVYKVNGARNLVRLGQTGFQPIIPVRLLGVSSENVTASDFTIALDLELREAALYRITNAAFEGLTDWQQLGPTPLATIEIPNVPRNAEDSYELNVERKKDAEAEKIDQYQLKFTLKPETR